MVMGVKTSSTLHHNEWSDWPTRTYEVGVCVQSIYFKEVEKDEEERYTETGIWRPKSILTTNIPPKIFNNFQHFSSLHKSTFEMNSYLLSGLCCIYYFHYYELWSRPPWDEWQSTMWDWGITGFGICGTICHHHPPHDPKNVCPGKYHYSIPRQNVDDTVETIRT